VAELEKEFTDRNPNILNDLNLYWNKILEGVNLEFDYQNAEISEISNNLNAYIKLKSGNPKSKTKIEYDELSTGIQNFIFKIGHIYSIFFNRIINRGFLLVDEPENSLFPDFLYDLIYDVYCKIIESRNTQFFVSTHNPIIATQFEPFERIILDFDDSHHVVAKKGTVPVGDDPNDILEIDFGLRSLMTKAGMKKYEQYLNLLRELKFTTDDNKKSELIKEISEIGNDYNFKGR
jgi:predicted ATP-dependent endonuclease of OLD family